MPHETEGDSQNAPDPKVTESGQPDISNVVNSAVSSHLKRFVEKQLPGIFAEALKPFQEQVAKLQAPPPADDEKSKNKQSPEMTALQTQLEEMKTRFAQETEQRIAAERKAREDRAYSEFKGMLAKNVRPEMLDMVADHLFLIKKIVEVPESGNPTFKGSRTQYGITEEVAYPLKDGVDNWLKSDDAKPFLPAPSASTTPTSKRQLISPTQLPPNFDPATATAEQKLQAASELEQKYAAALAARGFKVD